MGQAGLVNYNVFFVSPHVYLFSTKTGATTPYAIIEEKLALLICNIMYSQCGIQKRTWNSVNRVFVFFHEGFVVPNRNLPGRYIQNVPRTGKGVGVECKEFVDTLFLIFLAGRLAGPLV